MKLENSRNFLAMRRGGAYRSSLECQEESKIMNVSKRLIGIGGSAPGRNLSPMHSVIHCETSCGTYFFDNTDPDGTHRIYMVGNKVATYKHSYSQQLRYRLNNFFVAFVGFY